MGEDGDHTLKQRRKGGRKREMGEVGGGGGARYRVPDPLAGILHGLIVTLYLSHEKAIVILILQVIQLRSRVVLWPAGDHTANQPHWDPSIALSLHYIIPLGTTAGHQAKEPAVPSLPCPPISAAIPLQGHRSPVAQAQASSGVREGANFRREPTGLSPHLCVPFSFLY